MCALESVESENMHTHCIHDTTSVADSFNFLQRNLARSYRKDVLGYAILYHTIVVSRVGATETLWVPGLDRPARLQTNNGPALSASCGRRLGFWFRPRSDTTSPKESLLLSDGGRSSGLSSSNSYPPHRWAGRGLAEAKCCDSSTLTDCASRQRGALRILDEATTEARLPIGLRHTVCIRARHCKTCAQPACPEQTRSIPLPNRRRPSMNLVCNLDRHVPTDDALQVNAKLAAITRPWTRHRQAPGVRASLLILRTRWRG